jgi:hypothetical protein
MLSFIRTLKIVKIFRKRSPKVPQTLFHIEMDVSQVVNLFFRVFFPSTRSPFFGLFPARPTYLRPRVCAKVPNTTRRHVREPCALRFARERGRVSLPLPPGMLAWLGVSLLFCGSRGMWAWLCFRCFRSLVMPENFQHILRVMNTNLAGDRNIMYSLTAIKGVGRRYSNLCLRKAEISTRLRAGELVQKTLPLASSTLYTHTHFSSLFLFFTHTHAFSHASASRGCDFFACVFFLSFFPTLTAVPVLVVVVRPCVSTPA